MFVRGEAPVTCTGTQCILLCMVTMQPPQGDVVAALQNHVAFLQHYLYLCHVKFCTVQFIASPKAELSLAVIIPFILHPISNVP